MGRQTTAVGLTRLRTPSCTGVSVGGVVGSVAQWMDGSVMVLDGWMGGWVDASVGMVLDGWIQGPVGMSPSQTYPNHVNSCLRLRILGSSVVFRRLIKIET